MANRPKPQFSAGDPEMCFPKTLVDGEWRWQCPKGYHTVDDDETGQCYSNEGGCEYDDMVLLTDRPDKIWDRCASLYYFCSEYNGHPEHPACKLLQQQL